MTIAGSMACLRCAHGCPLDEAKTKKAFAISRKGLLSFGSPRRT